MDKHILMISNRRSIRIESHRHKKIRTTKSSLLLNAVDFSQVKVEERLPFASVVQFIVFAPYHSSLQDEVEEEILSNQLKGLDPLLLADMDNVQLKFFEY